MEPGWRYLPLSEYDYVSFFLFFFFKPNSTDKSGFLRNMHFSGKQILEVIWEEIFLSSDMSSWVEKISRHLLWEQEVLSLMPTIS